VRIQTNKLLVGAQEREPWKIAQQQGGELMARQQVIQALEQNVISCNDIKYDGRLTLPKSYGVYQILNTANAGKAFRYGNHPVRQSEIQREFGDCYLVYLFLEREHAFRMQKILNQDES